MDVVHEGNSSSEVDDKEVIIGESQEVMIVDKTNTGTI